MGKLEPFDHKMTAWQGLWWHPEINGYTSAVLSLADIRKFKGNVRLYMRKNKFYNNGENGRPNYNFCLRDAKAEVFNPLEVEEDEETEHEKIERLAKILREGRTNADRMALPSESQARADALMQEAISIVEELTGEKWEFSFMTF